MGGRWASCGLVGDREESRTREEEGLREESSGGMSGVGRGAVQRDEEEEGSSPSRADGREEEEETVSLNLFLPKPPRLMHDGAEAFIFSALSSSSSKPALSDWEEEGKTVTSRLGSTSARVMSSRMTLPTEKRRVLHEVQTKVRSRPCNGGMA